MLERNFHKLVGIIAKYTVYVHNYEIYIKKKPQT